MPLWGDEAALALNFLDRNFAELLSPLANAQVAPFLFLCLEKLALLTLGSSELALRLVPLVAGLAGLWLFFLLARRVLDPLPAALAVGILAVSYFTVRHSVEVKPYSCDLLAAVALQLTAVAYLKEKRSGLLIVWALLCPLALLLSFPAVFVFGASSLALLAGMRSASRGQWGLWFAGNLMGTLVFVWLFFVSSSQQYDAWETPMTTYWLESFPPASFWRIPLWLLETHAGPMMAYPVGGKNWGSIGTLLLCLVGIIFSFKKWPAPLHLLFGLPFVFTFLAAFLHLYPYGGSARISQYLAPAICLWTGQGAACLLHIVKNPKRHQIAIGAVFSVLVIIGLAGMTRDLLKPSKTPGDARARERVREWTTPGDEEATYFVWEPANHVSPNFQWYLRCSGREILWNARENRAWMQARSPIKALSFDRNFPLATAFPDFVLSEESDEHILVGPPEIGPDRWQSVRLERPPSAHQPAAGASPAQ